MNGAEALAGAVDTVRRGFGGGGCLRFRVTFELDSPEDLEAACAALEAIGGYNGYQPGVVAEALRSIASTLQRVEIGREYSPVLYLQVGDEYHVAGVMDAMRDAGAQECARWADPPGWIGSAVVRAWWD